ncbi:arylsulfatase [Tsukamurella sp. 1534]|uniref:arylsulfatase n=1 Tax=Tsukamurella sp. 1534 TaxID=1151061 RepID=UPI000A3455BE|nr:arylsulfatase [Tsukamurella sp. 1534]
MEPPTSDRLDARGTSYEKLTPLRPPEGAPNVVVVLLDDMGFGTSSAYGGSCSMPTAERLGDTGVKFSRFHTTALCSPTRAALLTGRNHHAVNMGTITNLATSVPGYTSVRPNTAATLAEVLRMNGYNTAAFGKMHQTPEWEVSAAGPFDRWPTGEGFEKFYGLMGGETDQWSPSLHEGTTPVDVPDDPDYHFSVDITDRAIEWTRNQRVLAPDKPFFVYLSFGATHAPHHVPQEWIEKYRGHFDHGWDVERERMLERQKALGVVPQDCELTRRHDELPAWDSLSDDERTVACRLMEAFAGFAEHTDHQVGRLVDAIETAGELDNTVILYILGDNGASGEGGLAGNFNEIAALNGVHDTTENILARLDEIGGPTAYNHYPAAWAHAMDAPYQWTKQVASHWGGTRVGMVAHWPEGIDGAGTVRDHWQHVIDVYPTILELAGLPVPESVNGVPQQRIDGHSFAEALRTPDAPERVVTQYFEMFGNRGVYHDGWSACTKHGTPWDLTNVPPLEDDDWELYAPDDWSQARNLAAEMPEKLAELQQLFLDEAERNHVLPLDDRRSERFNSDVAGRPDLLRGRTSMRLYPGMVRLAREAVPNVKNKSHRVTASITVPDGAAGVIFAQGSRFSGWCLRMEAGRLVYTHNYLAMESTDVVSVDAVEPGAHEVAFAFEVDEQPGFGRGGGVTLTVDGAVAGSGRIARTVPFLYSGSTDVGCDIGSGVVPSGYDTLRGEFTGSIEWVDIDIDEQAGVPETPAKVLHDIEVTIQ